MDLRCLRTFYRFGEINFVLHCRCRHFSLRPNLFGSAFSRFGAPFVFGMKPFRNSESRAGQKTETNGSVATLSRVVRASQQIISNRGWKCMRECWHRYYQRRRNLITDRRSRLMRSALNICAKFSRLTRFWALEYRSFQPRARVRKLNACTW